MIVPHDAPIRIVILPHGWVFVGRLIEDRPHNEECVLYNAAVVQTWGTTRGIGQIALEGPTPETVLAPCGTFRWQKGTEVGQIDCVHELWHKQLK